MGHGPQALILNPICLAPKAWTLHLYPICLALKTLILNPICPQPPLRALPAMGTGGACRFHACTRPRATTPCQDPEPLLTSYRLLGYLQWVGQASSYAQLEHSLRSIQGLGLRPPHIHQLRILNISPYEVQLSLLTM